MNDQLTILTLGGLTIECGGERVTGFASHKVEALLLYLALEKRPHSREILAEFFWPERSQSQSLANLRAALNSLRQQLAPYVIASQETVSINPEISLWLDTNEFETHLSRASQGDNADTEEIAGALTLYRGDFLEGFHITSLAFEDWARLERERLRYQAMNALDILIAHDLEERHYAQGITRATRLLQMDASREKTHYQLMQLLAQSGQRVAAMRQYETCCRLLTAELDVSPASQTTELYEKIVSGNMPTVAQPQIDLPEERRISNPYKGLRSFQETDAPDFFGREALIAQLITQLRNKQPQARFLAVVGPSGCGKSSVVRAGLIPALRAGAVPGSDRWWIADMMPGMHPFEELEAAILRVVPDPPPIMHNNLASDTRSLTRTLKRIRPPDQSVELLLIIDQFEELFSLVGDEAIRQHFLDSLLTAFSEPHSYLRLAIIVRGDFYDRLLLYPQLGDLTRQRTVAVLPLTPLELERVIVGPLERAGLTAEPGLVTSIVGDVSAQPGTLPLLQYALTELFERRDGRMLTLDAYHAAGGVHGALTRRMQELYGKLTPVHQQIARQLFLRLVQVSEGTEDTRRRVPMEEIRSIGADQTAVQFIVNTFAEYRLFTLDHDPATGKPTVEVAHEALLREWPPLREWIDESRYDVLQQRLLAASAAEWEQSRRDRSYLLMGTHLAQFEGWAEHTGVALTPNERSFLENSVTEDRRQRVRQRRVRNAALATSMAVALIMTVLSLIALDQQRRERNARMKAERQAAVNHSLVLAYSALDKVSGGFLDEALLLALEAVKIDDPPAEAVRALSRLAFGDGTRAVLRENGGFIKTVAFSPDARLALSGGCGDLVENRCTKGELILWDLNSKSEIRHFEGHTDWVNSAASSPDGLTILSGSSDSTLILWNVQTGKIVKRFEGHSGAVNGVVFALDGKTAFSGADDTFVIQWDITTGKIVRRFEGHTGAVTTVVLSPDGKTLASGSIDTTVKLWNSETGAILHTLEGVHTAKINAVAFHPTKAMLSVASADSALSDWNVQTGELIYQGVIGDDGLAINFTPDGQGAYIPQGSCLWYRDLTFSLRALGRGSCDYSGSYPSTSAVSPDGRLILLGYQDGHLLLLSTKHTSEIRRFEADIPFVTAAISPNGRYLLTGSYSGGVAVLWDLQTGQEVRHFEGQTGSFVAAIAISPDNRYALLGSGDYYGGTRSRELALVDLKTGAEIRQFEGHEFYLRSIAFSPDGRLAVSGSLQFGPAWPEEGGGELILWDVESGAIIRRFDDDRAVTSVDFGVSGKIITASIYGQFVAIWDISTNQPVQRFDYGSGSGAQPFQAIWGPDEISFLVTFMNGTIILYDTATGTPIRYFSGLQYPWSLALSPDHRYLAAGDGPGTIIVWDFATGEELYRFNAPGIVYNVVFAPDGQSVFSASYESPVIQWQIADWPLDKLLAWVHENRYVREFTCEERVQYRIEPLCG